MSSTPTCPLCQMTLTSDDDLQLHYLTSCSVYDMGIPRVHAVVSNVRDQRTSPISHQPPPNLSSIGQTPVMQEAATQGIYSARYYRQLSSKGFNPEPVKSKSGTTSTVIPNNTRPAPSTLVTHRPSQSMAQAGQRSTDASPQTANIAETATFAGSQNIRSNMDPPPDTTSGDGDGGGGFNVRQLQQEKEDMAVDYERQLLKLSEQLAMVTSERDDLRQNQERVKGGREMRGLEKELSEVKDQNAALQSQLQEYMGVITDQSKVIQSGKVHDSEYIRVQQLNIHLGEFMKKQQLEYEEAISSLKKKISHITKLGDENLKIHQLNVTLTAELEDYHTQTKRLLADLQQKDAVLAEKEAEVDQLRQQGGYHSSSSSDRDKMELDMLKQKCDAWREEAEKLAPLRDEVGRLHTHASALEEKIKFLKADNEGLGKQLQSVTEESERNRTETYRKAPPDYDNLRDRLIELQQVRVQLENELIPLREERAAILTENARLKEGAQPEKYTKLKEDYDVLEGHCKEVQIALEEEKTAVIQLQQQLSEATTSGSDKLQTIRERMERYRQEREGAKGQVEELQWQLQRANEELQHVSETSESNIEQLQNQLSQYDQEVSALKAKAQANESRMHRYREERNQAQLANQTFQHEISTLKQTVQSLNDEIQGKNQVASETMQQLSDLRKEKDVQIEQLQRSLTETTQQLSDVRREKDARIQRLKQRLSTTASHTHSQVIEFWRVAPNEVQVDQVVIGRGAWGYVCKGRFRGQQVAVKMVYPEILKPHTEDRIRREMSTMAQVRHPNLVLFIAAVLDDGTSPMIITEILDTTLRKAYEDNQLGSNKLRVFRDVASALNYLHLHRQPIIHRDVSTANVLLEAVANDVWKAKLSDFGSANLVRFATTPAEGAIIYTAPEAFPQHPRSRTSPPPQTPKIDVYSYGVLVGEVVTEELPDPDELQEMVQQVQRQWPQIHPLVKSSTEEDPDNRPTMAYILDKLEKI